MKNLSLKLIAVLFVSVLGYSLHAQQTIPYGEDNTTYSVDLTAPDGGPNGTAGSTYVWTIFDVTNTDITGTTMTIVPNTPSGNVINIDWDTTPPGVYTLSVVETNNLCSAAPVVGTVTILPPGIPNLAATNANMCPEDLTTDFEITGAPANSIITFTVTGGTATSPITVDASGNATITVTHDGTSPQIDVTITDMVLADGTPNNIPDQTASTTVTIITTSAINFTP